MNKFDTNTFKKLYDKYNKFTNEFIKISPNKLNNILESFNDFLINFYLDNNLLYNSAKIENDYYYIIKSMSIIKEFGIMKFDNYKKFLVKNYMYFDSITAECIYLSNN